MNSDDVKRLAEIRTSLRLQGPYAHINREQTEWDLEFVLQKYDEQGTKLDESERARREAEGRAATCQCGWSKTETVDGKTVRRESCPHCLRAHVWPEDWQERAEKAEAALAEEHAKRKTVVQFGDEHMQALREARDRQKERAEAAEARVRALESELARLTAGRQY